ncbi:hypothetical protein ACI6Q2_22380 [Chitinophagaceae bacterium LWZ2-11]
MAKAYNYLFYKFYKIFEASPSRWWSEWKAMVVIFVLELWMLLSLTIYYAIIKHQDLFSGEKPLFLTVVITIIGLTLINYFIFIHEDKWKNCVKEFDCWPTRKNRIGSLIVLLFVLLVAANLIFSFYEMSKINYWTLQI